MMNTRYELSGPLGLSMAAIIIILIVMILEIPALVSSASTASGSAVPEQDSVNTLINVHEQAMATDRERFNGRSFFFRPPAPPRPKPVVKTPVVTAPPPPPPPVNPKPVEPTYPRNYTGPDLQAIVGPTAFFRPSSGGLIVLNVGETEQDIELLGTAPPRTIEVKYKGGGPYSVTLFEMGEPDFFNKDIDQDAAEADIVSAIRDEDESEPLLAGQSGWPAGTIAGDPVRILYRQGPYEASITGMLARANQAWLVIDVETFESPIEIYKADVISVQNLKPQPPEPEPELPEEVAHSANDNATAANDNATTASNDNASSANDNATAANDNATTASNDNASSANDNATAAANDNATTASNDNASSANDNATAAEEPEPGKDPGSEPSPDTEPKTETSKDG